MATKRERLLELLVEKDMALGEYAEISNQIRHAQVETHKAALALHLAHWQAITKQAGAFKQ